MANMLSYEFAVATPGLVTFTIACVEYLGVRTVGYARIIRSAVMLLFCRVW